MLSERRVYTAQKCSDDPAHRIIADFAEQAGADTEAMEGDAGVGNRAAGGDDGRTDLVQRAGPPKMSGIAGEMGHLRDDVEAKMSGDDGVGEWRHWFHEIDSIKT
jgi:hypothetical protein